MRKTIYKKNPFKPMLICAMFGALILLFVTTASAQSKENGAPIIPVTQNVARTAEAAEADLKDCAQMLDQSIEEARSCSENKAALEKLLAKTGEGERNALKLAAERLETINSQKLTIERLTEIKCSTVKIFWIYKRKTCY